MDGEIIIMTALEVHRTSTTQEILVGNMNGIFCALPFSGSMVSLICGEGTRLESTIWHKYINVFFITKKIIKTF